MKVKHPVKASRRASKRTRKGQLRVAGLSGRRPR